MAPGDGVAILALLVNFPAVNLVVTLVRHLAVLVVDRVNKLDDYRMALVDDPRDDLAISDLLANELVEIVVQTLDHLPVAPVVDEVIKTVHHDVDQMIMIAADPVVIATRDPHDHLDEMPDHGICCEKYKISQCPRWTSHRGLFFTARDKFTFERRTRNESRRIKRNIT